MSEEEIKTLKEKVSLLEQLVDTKKRYRGAQSQIRRLNKGFMDTIKAYGKACDVLEAVNMDNEIPSIDSDSSDEEGEPKYMDAESDEEYSLGEIPYSVDEEKEYSALYELKKEVNYYHKERDYWREKFFEEAGRRRESEAVRIKFRELLLEHTVYNDEEELNKITETVLKEDRDATEEKKNKRQKRNHSSNNTI